METKTSKISPLRGFLASVKKNNKVAFYFLSFTILLLVSLVVLKSSLFLSFPDGDWLAILFARQFPDFARLFRPYGFQSIFFVNLYNIFQDNYFFYYLIGIVLRSLSGLGITILLFDQTKDKLLSPLGGLLFCTGFTGVETNSVIGTMNTYISIFSALYF